jgi:8-oxo-dGTP pyrophosphatase MutT (NUDIX family)
MRILRSHKFRFCSLCGGELIPFRERTQPWTYEMPEGHFVHCENPLSPSLRWLNATGATDAQTWPRAVSRALGLPGGFVEAGERPAETIKREIFEQVALCVEVPRVIGTYRSRYGDDGNWTVDVTFHCQASPGELSLSAESS